MLALFALSLTALVCFAGCISGPVIAPEQSSIPAVDATNTYSAVHTDPPATAGQASAVPVTDAPATVEHTPEVTPVFPVDEYNIGPENGSVSRYIANVNDPARELMTADEIASANARMIKDCPALADIIDVPVEISGETLKNMINGVSVPEQPLYDQNGKEISEAAVEAIKALMDADNIPENAAVVPGIVVRRANLKRLPTELEFHSFAGSNVDRIQDTELYLGMPVWVLHYSADGKFAFVRSYYYSGWTKADNIASAKSKEAWLEFADPERYAVVTDARLDIYGIQADMGVKLPYVDIDGAGEFYTVKLPVRNQDGSLGSEQIKISVHSAHRGYLKYTYANFIVQAFKFEGTMYSWGGLKEGVDCSSYVASVMRPFGFLLPRDTKDQNYSVGTAVEISGMNEAEVRKAVTEAGNGVPLALYANGHVKFYIGLIDGVPMTIHAPGSNKTVKAEPLEQFGNIISVRMLLG